MSYVKEALSVAPMMDCTDKHWRMFVRGITSKTVLYTEMAVDSTLLHQDRYMDFSIGKDICEHPSVIQLGGSDPAMLTRACTVINEFHSAAGTNLYQEINLNCGCPSARVSQRCFGAQLMLEPERVREIVYQMGRTSSVPVTVKCRLGADNKDSYSELRHFVSQCESGGVKKIIVHARKCLLAGLTTKQNRDIPPLRYAVVHRLVRDFPSLEFVINGGIQTLQEGLTHTQRRYPARPAQSVNSTGSSWSVSSETDRIARDVSVSSLGIGSSSSGSGRAVLLSGVFAQPSASTVESTEALVQSVFDSTTESGATMDREGDDLLMSSLHTNDDRVTGADTDAVDGEDLPPVHGVMIGRAAVANPLILARADSTYFGTKDPNLTRREILERYINYCEEQMSDDTCISRIGSDGKIERVTSALLLRPVAKLMTGLPGGGSFRAELSKKYLSLLTEIKADQKAKGLANTVHSSRLNPSCRAVVSLLVFVCCGGRGRGDLLKKCLSACPSSAAITIYVRF